MLPLPVRSIAGAEMQKDIGIAVDKHDRICIIAGISAEYLRKKYADDLLHQL